MHYLLLFALSILWPVALSAASAQCTFQQVGPITVTQDYTTISAKEITANGNGNAAINTNGHNHVTIDSVKIHHWNGADGIVVSQGSYNTTVTRANIEGWVGSGANMKCNGADWLYINNVRIHGGVSGIVMNNCNNSTLIGVEGSAQTGKWDDGTGSFVQWTNSTTGSLQDFYNLQYDLPLGQGGTSGDGVNIYQSNYITVSNGLIDGMYGTPACAVQDDLNSSNLRVSNVDAVHTMDCGFGAYGAGGNSGVFTNVRVRDNQDTSMQGPPYGGGKPTAFIGNCQGDPMCIPGPKTGIKMTGSYWNLTPNSQLQYHLKTPPNTFTNVNYTQRKPFYAGVCPF